MKSKDVLNQTIMFYERLLGSIRRFGLVATFIEGLKFIFWMDVTLFKFHIITKNAYELEKPLPGIELREARPEEYPQLLEFSADFGKQEMLDRLALNHKCIIAWEKGKIVFYGWIGINKVWLSFIGRHIEFPQDTAYFYNTFTAEDYRGKMLLPAFISYAREFCADNNMPFGFTLVFPETGLPVRAYSKLVGAEKISLFRFQRRLGIKSYSEREISIKEAANLTKRAKK